MTTRVNELWANAKEAISAGDWKRARLFMEELTHMLPQEPMMAYNRGLVHWKLEEYEAAEEWLVRALELKPEFPQAAAALKYVRDITGLQDAPTNLTTNPVEISEEGFDEEGEWLLGAGFWPRR